MAPLRPVLLRTLADVQQRLTFRAQAYIKVAHSHLDRPCLYSRSVALQSACILKKDENHADLNFEKTNTG